MPRRSTPDVPATTGTSLTIPPDIRADLLRAQAAAITTPQRFARVKVLPAAVRQFEFSDTNDTTREFSAVILGHHARNVLWDAPYGTERRNDDEENAGPACRSDDGIHGTPREGFAHAALGNNLTILRRAYAEGEVATGLTEATGNEVLDCASCPYNQWESKWLVGGEGKGRAATRQRSIYLLLEDRATPMELTISNTSIPLFDEYLTRLLNHGLPAQAVRTRFAQEIKTRGTMRWAVVTYAQESVLTSEEFDEVMVQYRQWATSINPSNRDAIATTAPNAETLEVREGELDGDEGEIPNF